MGEEVEESIDGLRQCFRTGRTRSVAWRKSQLGSLLRLVSENEEKIFAALYQDLGKHPVECYRDELGVVLKSAAYAFRNLDKWVAPKAGNLPLLFFPARGQLIPEPLGVVLVISSWNFPISLALDPVIGALSAGNAVVLKPSELAPACSAFLAEHIPLYLDTEAVKVVEGGVDMGERLLKQRWDKIFFTGGPKVGQIVMSAAARYLTPVTLELGGKCPAILDTLSNAYDIKIMVKRIAGGKWGPCCGQACIGVDYILVERKFSTTLIELLQRTIKKFYGENPQSSKSICRIVNRNHFERLKSMLKDPAVADSIKFGGSMDEEKLFIEPTILLDPPLDSELMMSEIFGPLLPIITVDDIQESIEFINSRPKPLAIYAFTNNEAFKQRIIRETSSGSITFNDVMVQFVCDELPFGGVGQSGFGRYHGKYSFDTFSHEKAVMRRGFFPELEPRYPPWNDFKLRFIRLAYRFNYLGLLLLMLLGRR